MQYEIKGDLMPVVICRLDSGESVLSEAGAMSWMTPNLVMETVGGGAGKVFGRMFSGETLFQNRFTAQGGPGTIAFASSFPGSIRAVEIDPGHPVVVQKRGFLASEAGVELSVFFKKKLASGLFGGEGFIMEKLSGRGTAFVEIDGSTVEYDLGPGERLIASTGQVAMMDATCTLDVQTVKGVKNALFGGEGLFHTVITGPGRVVLQTMPLINFASAIAGMLPSSN